MGASASLQTIVNNISNEMKVELKNTAKASAEAKCSIEFGRVQFKKTVGCTIKMQNFCSAEASASIDAVVNASFKVYNNLTTEQKEEGAKLFTLKANMQTTVNNIKNDFKTYVENNCDASTRIENGIKVQDFIIDECVAPAGQIMAFEFINSGQAKASCGIKTVMDIIATSSTEVTAQQKSMNVDTILWIALGIGIPLILAGLLYYMRECFIVKPRDKIEIELAKKNSPAMNLLTLARGLKTVS